MRKLRERLCNKLAQGHTVKNVSKYPKGYFNQSTLLPEPMLLKKYLFLDARLRGVRWISLLKFTYFQRKQKTTPKQKS